MLNPANLMTVNQEAIQNHAPQYIERFTTKFGHPPTSWFTYFRWLAVNTSLGSFTDDDVQLAMEVLGLD